MSSELISFVATARERGLDNATIKQKLISEGWDAVAVEQAMQGIDPLIVPKPPSPAGASSPGLSSNVAVTNQTPVPVVQNLTTRGIEYKIMFFALWISAIAFGGLLHDFIDSFSDSSSYPHIGGLFGITALVVCLPIFAYLFIRLKTAEFNDNSLRRDQSRKSAIQGTLIFSFLIGVGNLIGMVYLLLSSGDSGVGSDVNIGSLIAHTFITILICGSIFGYYWKDIHRD